MPAPSSERRVVAAACLAIVALLALQFALLGAGTDVRAAAGVKGAGPKAATAQAQSDARFPLAGPSLQTAMTIAREYWGANLCGGAVTVNWVRVGPSNAATASWRNPTDAWNNAPQNFDCRIDLNANVEFDWRKLCTVVTHEVGHLLGQQHDPVPGRLMSAYYTSPLPRCAQTADPAAPPAAKPKRGTPAAKAKARPLRRARR